MLTLKILLNLAKGVAFMDSAWTSHSLLVARHELLRTRVGTSHENLSLKCFPVAPFILCSLLRSIKFCLLLTPPCDMWHADGSFFIPARSSFSLSLDPWCRKHFLSFLHVVLKVRLIVFHRYLWEDLLKFRTLWSLFSFLEDLRNMV